MQFEGALSAARNSPEASAYQHIHLRVMHSNITHTHYNLRLKGHLAITHVSNSSYTVYVCMYALMRACRQACVCMYVYVSVCIRMHAYVVCVCMCLYMYVQVYVYECV